MKKPGKQEIKTFKRTFALSTVILCCAVFGFLTASKAYENTVRIGYGIYRKAVVISREEIRFFDFKIK